jgi:hypothetical protein
VGSCILEIRRGRDARRRLQLDHAVGSFGIRHCSLFGLALKKGRHSEYNKNQHESSISPVPCQRDLENNVFIEATN